VRDSCDITAITLNAPVPCGIRSEPRARRRGMDACGARGSYSAQWAVRGPGRSGSTPAR